MTILPTELYKIINLFACCKLTKIIPTIEERECVFFGENNDYNKFPNLNCLTLTRPIINLPKRITNLHVTFTVHRWVPIFVNISEYAYVARLRHLRLLRISLPHINELPQLPPMLREFDCNGCTTITHIPVLPSTLTVLKCYNSTTLVLPTLPDTLKVLICYRAMITALPELPMHLIELDCSNNAIVNIPDLPLGLISLVVSGCRIEKLPILPPILKKLSANRCCLSTLPELPSTLITLCCTYNGMLNHLPTLPPRLESLNCSYNPIKYLPTLPDTVNLLVCSNTLICEAPILMDGTVEYPYKDGGNEVLKYRNKVLVV